MFFFETAVVLLSIFIGARLKGIGLGIMGGLGLAILVFIFNKQPINPPIDVLLIITTVVVASSIFELSGGLNYLVYIAEKILRKHPEKITYLSPIIAYIFTFCTGTSHICYAILPVIAQLAKETGITPQKPLSAAVTASQQAITASPISAATVIVIGLLSPLGVSLIDILKICVPATLSGSMIAAFVVSKKKNIVYEDKKKIAFSPNILLTPKTKIAVGIFLTGILTIIFYGAFKQYRPIWYIQNQYITMRMATIIEIIMLATASIIALVCKVNTTSIAKGKVFLAGMQAIIAIFGISWLGNTFFKSNETLIMATVQESIVAHPWQFSLYLFALSIIMLSQGAATCTLMPLGISIGLPPPLLIAMFPAANGLFFVPNHPTILAAINFDTTGSTRIGKYILNHSFMLPGIVATTCSVIVGYGLIKIFF